MKRKDYLSWEEYFMGLAILSSERSKDPSTQVGACIVGEDGRVLSIDGSCSIQANCKYSSGDECL